MVDLVSDSEWTEFKSAIADVFETFANTDVTIRRRTTGLTAVNQNITNDNTSTDTILKAVFVQIGTDTDAQVKLDHKGSLDRTEMYVLFNYEVYKAAGLIDANGNNLVLEGKDSIIIRTKKYDIIGINELGPVDNDGALPGQEALVKIHLLKPVLPQHIR